MASGQLPISNFEQYPLKDVPEPHAHDVLCGRGGGTNNHIGNSHWRMLVAANKQLYITLPKRQKMLLSRSIVNAVRSQNPPGRFLQKHGKTKLWFDVGDQRAQEKTSQALREGAPDIRKKVAATKTTVVKDTTTTTGASTMTPAEPTSGDTSKSGVERDGGNIPQIPAHSLTPAAVAPKQQTPESNASSTILSQTMASGVGMIPPSDPQHYNPQQQQQQMNDIYDNNSAGHMTLNERRMMIQNAMMNGARLNGQHHLQINNNDNNFQPSHSTFPYQQHHQQDHLQQQIHQRQDYQQQYQYQQQLQQQQQLRQEQQQYNNDINYQQQQHHQQQLQQCYQEEQQQQYHENNNSMPTFDDFVAAPPEELERDGLSFGSLHMTDTEMNKLQQTSSHDKSKRKAKKKDGLGFGSIHMTDAEMNKLQQASSHGKSRRQANQKDGLGFGSIHMTDAEMNKLQQTSSHGNSKQEANRRHSISQQQPQYQEYNDKASNNNNDNDNSNSGAAAPMGGVLEPTGTSFGDISMHSANTNFQMKLEETGTSFGTMMSFNTSNTGNNPDMVDGGLMDAVGTSFGSLTLDKSNRDMLFKTLEIAAGGAEVPPMFQSETVSSRNLLECSDTESESSREKEQLTKQKSQAWEMMKTQLQHQTSKGASVDSHDLMPPPVGFPQHNINTNSNNNHNTPSAAATFDNIEIALPPTTMEANFSTLSAWSAADDDDSDDDSDDDVVAIPLPPPQLTKTDS